MPHHPLHRPVWNALHGGWKPLVQGDGEALRIDPRYGPFAAAADDGPAAQGALAALVPEGGEAWIVEPDAPAPPPGTRLVREAVLAQMVAEEILGESAPVDHILLTDADAEEMRALALLTKPGPFLPLTHRLGRFIGIREGGKLIAMAGERMRMPGFAEVSGVCTHPDHRGRGHAKQLMRIVASAMLERGETPFLHAYAAHEATVALYERLGFRVRARMHMMVIAPG
ncbi:GNAT family N-acetyltransferase [Sphingobium chlorophenolicum]|uniref:GCN5-related N-acetyltransferase n=1 Tax=Sphingobium chlorophenolicum TaxID=46429 RepID=A0A081RBC9_SPHCR|nr:GNAT family N-acetyltransferase [Sphingobium chlorophenolicum]KEQ52502.1 GCN5-related N-acetyltransferase [Sphingobium chlorophenolicum]